MTHPLHFMMVVLGFALVGVISWLCGYAHGRADQAKQSLYDFDAARQAFWRDLRHDLRAVLEAERARREGGE